MKSMQVMVSMDARQKGIATGIDLISAACLDQLLRFLPLFFWLYPLAKANGHDTSYSNLERLKDDCRNLHLGLIDRINVDVHD